MQSVPIVPGPVCCSSEYGKYATHSLCGGGGNGGLGLFRRSHVQVPAEVAASGEGAAGDAAGGDGARGGGGGRGDLVGAPLRRGVRQGQKVCLRAQLNHGTHTWARWWAAGGGRKWVGRRGIWIFAPGGGEELCALGGGEGGGYTTQKVTIKSPQMTFYVGKKSFRNFILKNGIVKAILWMFT